VKEVIMPKHDVTLMAVYGTLKRGFYNHFMLTTSKFVGKASVPGYIWKGPGENFPRAMADSESIKSFEVELYEVSPTVIRQVARLELPYGYYPQLVVTQDKMTALMWASAEGPNPDCTMLDGVYNV